MRRSTAASRLILSSIPSPAALPRSRRGGLVLAAALLVGAATQAAGAPSLVGVHWYSGDSSMLDLSVPAGERGYNVEVIFDTGWCDGNPSTDPGDVRSVAATAKAHGLVNIIRVDYRQLQAVPTSSGEYGSWAAGFIKCTQELGDLASLFIVGNEPNVEDGGRAEGDIRGDEYASAFNYLYSRKAEMPSATQLLATFNSPFTPPGWMLDMSSRLSGVDGFALHTGGVRASCRDPRQACSYGGWSFDGAFRYYRDVIASIHSSWWSRPVYITEFNTYTGDVGSEPDVNYPGDWINQAFEEIRGYNASRGTRPAVKALCWFVDRPQSWPRFSLRTIGAARTDMSEEFKNPANRGAGGTCPNDVLATLSDRWKLEIWNNKAFAGGTVEQRYDAAGSGGFSFNWGSGRPSNCVGNDNFAVRFSRQAYFPTSASYTFTATTDDGVRLFVDGNTVIDDWRDMAPTGHTAVVSLTAGWHDLRMDYYENAGGAVATLSWTGGGTPPANVARTAVGWAASSIYAAAYGGDKAYDGIVSVASKWTSNGATADSWLALDLGRSYDVTQFVVKHAGSAGELKGYNTQAFRLESGTSLSGPWTARATVANTAQDPTSTVTLASPLTTRYVRLYITDAGIDNYARIPEIEVYGVASGTPGPATLVNGDFESGAPGGAVGTGWTAFSSAGYAPTFAVASDQVHGGSLAQRVVSPQPSSNDKFGGVYQVVATTPGLQYTVRAWNRTHFTGGLAWDHIARLGIDLGGGTSFEAPAVQWAEFNSAKDAWHPLEVAVTATSSSMTIYLESWRKWASGGDSLTWFDDVQVVQGTPPPVNRPPTAVASANPRSGPAPLTVAFDGSASSDPDGDALTYSWSFGDGAQGTGATVSHTYSARGNYTATLTVNDGHGGTNSASVAITVVAAAGSLVNGDFESSTPGSALGTGWIAFSSSGYAPTFAVVSGPDQVHGGSLAQRVTSPQPSSSDKFAGIYQVVATTPGLQYTVRAWNRTRFTGGGAWDHIARLGIDLNGGNDFQASSVQWLEFDSAKDAWHPLEEVVTATGGSVTIYLESWRKWASGGDSLTWFDDVQVEPNSPPPVNHPPTAVATASPSSGPAPLAVAFNGSGSTDPDGDPLTYAWSFGDGTQGSGVSVSHTYSASGSYAATLTVDDRRGGTHTAEVVIVVDPPSGNRPPIAVISANPKSATIPFTVTLDASSSSDPDGDVLTYSWRFADGVQGTGPTIQRTFPLGDFHKGEAPDKYAGGYLVTLTATDAHGATSNASLRIAAFPQNCPDSLDFDAKRAELAAQGKALAFVKVGFHARSINNQLTGLGHWERCLDAAGVPFSVKSVDNAGRILEGAALKATSGVPHTLIYRRSGDNAPGFELPNYDNPGGPTAEAEAQWQLHLQDLPNELKTRKDAFWIETINEPDKGRSEWLAEFALRQAQLALAAGYNYAAFGWAGGTPELEAWDGPKMRAFLEFAGQHPDRVAIALHEYNFWDVTFKETYPILIGRFTRLYEHTDAMGLPRPTVLVTEFAYPGGSEVGWAMNPDNIPWAASLYAQYPRVLGATIYDEGSLVQHIARMTEFALGTYFTIP